jgi:urease accessory protein
MVLQLADSAFPAGGFAHSAGLEAAAQLGEVRDARGVEAFLRDAAWQAGFGSLPLVAEARRAPDRVTELDRAYDAFLLGAIANRASRTQGRAFIAACAHGFGVPALVQLHGDVRERRLLGHHAPLFGAACAKLAVAEDDTAALWMHSIARGVLSAAVRLGLVGASEAQGLQRDAAPMLARIVARCRGLGSADIAQTAPRLDLIGSQHDRLYSRLFQS